MTKFQAPKVPYVEARHHGSNQKPTAIALTLSGTTSEKGAALGIANCLHALRAPTNSFHYIVDEAEIYKGVWDNVAASSSPYRALAVQICCPPHEEAAMWEDASAAQVLYQAADLVADLILAYKIRPRYLDDELEVRWRKWRTRRRGGILVQVQGEWPYESFLADVQSRVTLKGAR